MPKMIVTPINLVTKYIRGNTLAARVDYKREREFFNSNTISPKWDDNKYNKACIGDIFGFVHNIENRIELFHITGILKATDRPGYWNLPEHKQRNVIILSKKITQKNWSDVTILLNKPNWKVVMGTTCISEKSLNQFTLDDNEPPPYNEDE